MLIWESNSLSSCTSVECLPCIQPPDHGLEAKETITERKIFSNGAKRLHSMQLIAGEWLAGETHLHNRLHERLVEASVRNWHH